MLTNDGLNIGARAISGALDGGRLELYDESGTTLAILRFTLDAFIPPEDGRAMAKPLRAPGKLTGIATQYKAFGAMDVVIDEGPLRPLPVAQGVTVSLDNYGIEIAADEE